LPLEQRRPDVIELPDSFVDAEIEYIQQVLFSLPVGNPILPEV
jgi:hypothetical protein